MDAQIEAERLIDPMEFGCPCGAAVSVDGEGHETEADFHTICEACGRGYIITISQIRGQSGDGAMDG